MRGGGDPPKKNFVTRYENPYIFPVINNSDGTVSTHKMASAEVDGVNIAYPTIVQAADGRLYDLNNVPGSPINYAMNNNEYLKFSSKKEAEGFASGGYKKRKVKKMPIDADGAVDEFDLGGQIVSGASAGYTLGNSFGPEGAVVGLIVGAAYGAVAGGEEEKREEKRKLKAAKAIEYGNRSKSFNNYINPMQFATGGVINAEIEGGEVVQTGNTVESFEGASHEQGGIDIAAPSGSRVFSDRLKLGKHTFAKLANKKMRQAARSAKELEKYQSVENENTAMLMDKNLNSYLDSLFVTQELMKQDNGEQVMRKGGVMRKMYSGGNIWDEGDPNAVVSWFTERNPNSVSDYDAYGVYNDRARRKKAQIHDAIKYGFSYDGSEDDKGKDFDQQQLYRYEKTDIPPAKMPTLEPTLDTKLNKRAYSEKHHAALLEKYNATNKENELETKAQYFPKPDYSFTGDPTSNNNSVGVPQITMPYKSTEPIPELQTKLQKTNRYGNVVGSIKRNTSDNSGKSFDASKIITAVPSIYNAVVGLTGQADYIDPTKYMINKPTAPDKQVSDYHRIAPIYRAAMRNANPYTQHIVANAASGAISQISEADRQYNYTQQKDYEGKVLATDAANKQMALQLATGYNPQAKAAKDAYTAKSTEGFAGLSLIERKEVNQIRRDRQLLETLVSMYPNVTLTEDGRIVYRTGENAGTELTDEALYKLVNE